MNSIDLELLHLLPKIGLAILCGFIVGYDREIKHKVAGIRTNILICVGCTILTTASFVISDQYPGSDPSRMISQIITGIGFLGAGVIFKNADKVMGVTTASFIWLISSIGILIGCGAVFVPVGITIALVIASHLFESVELLVKKK